ncbi:LpxI family protein [Methylocapsa sp. S129]|uniref:LpxI family protein n=1 Tax=Methylocapsa sp. S129 TaxID=1641869 RepID=UPI00131C5633|nr:UDP-2,3-diacylglucosamine diphosphatase LpxI [Methylocapsa sp. S129]
MSLAANASSPGDPGAAQMKPLAILCGGGDFPIQVAQAVIQQGRSPVLVGIVGAADERIEAFAHFWIHMGEVGKLFRSLKERDVVEIAIVGAMTRPEFADLRLDWGAVRRLAGLASLFRGGDNHLLVGIARLFESEGVAVVGVHQIAPQLLVSPGALTVLEPSTQAQADARQGRALIGALSPFDAGQAVIVANGRVLAIEAAEGTDSMLARVAEMRNSHRLRFKGRAGVLVKTPKSDQDMRLDMPAVGLKTIEGAQRAQLEGIALAAGRVLIADRAAFARAADEAGLFVFGLET